MHNYERSLLPVLLKKYGIPDEVSDKKNMRKKPAFSILIRLLFKQSTFSALHVYKYVFVELLISTHAYLFVFALKPLLPYFVWKE